MTLAEVSSVCSGLFVGDELMWNHTAASMSLLANINASKGRKFKPEDFHPYMQVKKNKPVTKKTAEELYEHFKNF
jgi:hypothetical protein